MTYKNLKITIDPACDILYSSFYIYGLQQVFGNKAITYSSKYFKEFQHNNHFFAFVIQHQDQSQFKKIIIDFTDASSIDKKALEWCDVYGKINKEQTINSDPKILAIGPSFGIRFMGFFKTGLLAIGNLLKAYRRIPNKRKFLSDYKAQFYRPKMSDYNSGSTIFSYVFFMASLWKNENQTNEFRANFIKSCKSNAIINFEGGFAPRTRNDMKGYEHLTTDTRIPIDTYLKKIKHSTVVFNTPAVKGCHGWKLAEYLALGKAIISTPLSRQLPSPLEDGIGLLITNGEKKDIEQKLTTLLNHPKVTEQLGRNARLYFENELQPTIVIQKLANVKMF